MKKYLTVLFPIFAIQACSKIEEKVTQTIEKTTRTVKDKAEQSVKETISETVSNSLNSLTNAENAAFKEVFPFGNEPQLTDFTGKKIRFPNGSEAYVFKYKTEKDPLLKFLESQETADESQSDTEARKIDGKSFREKLLFVEKFLPPNTIDLSFLTEMKNDRNIEYYKLKRFPRKSTVIFNPKNNQVFHFVEISQ